ncbi:MAG: hypothetical protein LAN71_09390 [Acidobacteriia bacterium]|nr:hypothetical protein [Terriglobia bacterium]
MITVIGGLIVFSAVLRCEEPIRVTACELKRTPAAFNHKLIEVTGFVSHGFEDFGLFDPSCPSWPYVWVEYGGIHKSGTMYCCGVSAERTRPEELVVEGIEVPLTTDEIFDAFDKLIQTNPDTLVRATFVGRFFAGKEIRHPKGEMGWGGYGHMGCCSLFVIQKVLSVAPHERKDLDYGASPDQPNIGKTGCGYRDLLRADQYPDWIEAQHTADHQQNDWVFDDPKQVATAALSHLAKIDEKTAARVRKSRQLQGRIIYDLKTNGGKVTYMIVVSRPYLLSFYAEDPKKIAWVVIAAYKSSCDEKLLSE